ncbi:MAG: ATP-binding protein [Pseudorhodoplanes sp.]
MGFLKPVGDFIDALVHATAQKDASTAARHRAFIARRVVGSLIAFAAFPVYVALLGTPSGLEAAVFAWMLVPILVAAFLSRTGRYETAHILSSSAITVFIAAIAFRTGGMTSFAAVWLVVVPIEAALSASRRTAMLAFGIALGGMLALVVGDVRGFVPDNVLKDQNAVLAMLGVSSAGLYAFLLALGAGLSRRTATPRATDADYDTLLQQMSDAVVRHGRNGAVRFISPAAGNLFGVRVDQLSGHGLLDRVHVADRPAYLTALARAADGDAQTVEFRALHRGTQFVWVEMRCSLIRKTSHSDAAREVIAVMRDITDRKTQEQEIETTRAESAQADAAKTRFLATMSHELRTPLNAIIGFSEMLMQEEAMRIDAKRRGEYAKLINDSGHHLLSVVNGILDMSKMETGDFKITPEPFAPAQVISHCCDLLALKAREAGLEITIRAASELPDIVADKRAVKQILINLLSNAIKFTDRGGRIIVHARTKSSDFILCVEDTGIGISDADLPRLGNPFFQAGSAYDRRHDGTGLGLSIVKGLVRLHGGTLDVTSELGKGTRISVTIPVDCERRRTPSVASPPMTKIAHPDFSGKREADHTSQVKKRA